MAGAPCAGWRCGSFGRQPSGFRSTGPMLRLERKWPRRWKRWRPWWDMAERAWAGWVSIVVLSEERVYSWRSRPAHLDLGTELGAEARRVAVSVRDRHHLEVRRLWLSERPPVSPSLAAELGNELATDVRPLQPLA